MFFVVNKEKLYAYIVSIVTVAMLFAMAGILVPNNTVETSANIQNNIAIENSNKDNSNISNE